MFNLVKTLVVVFILTFVITNAAAQTEVAAGNDPIRKSTIANGFISIKNAYLPNVEGIEVGMKSRDELFIKFTNPQDLALRVWNVEGVFMYAMDIKTNVFMPFHYEKGYKYSVDRKTSTPCDKLCMHLEGEVPVLSADDAKTSELNEAQK